MPEIAHDVEAWLQTNDPSDHGQQAACSGAAVTADTGNDVLVGPTEEDGGSPGLTPITSTAAASATEALFFFESRVIPYTRWTAGKWNVGFQYASGGVGCTLEEIHICRLNSSGVSQGSVASLTGLAIPVDDLFTARAQEFVLDQASTVTATATDRAFIVFVVDNPTGAPVDIEWIPNAYIVTPIRKTVQVGEWTGTPDDRPSHPVVRVTVFPPDVTFGTQSIDCPVVRVPVSVQTQIRVLGGEELRL